MDQARQKRVPVTGYTDRLSARGGEYINVKLSAQGADRRTGKAVDVWLTSCVCADPNPVGPGIIERQADQWFERSSYRVFDQQVVAGSYGITKPVNVSENASRYTIEAIIWPTQLNGSVQCIASWGALSLCITADNTVGCLIGTTQYSHQRPLASRQWVRVAMVYEPTPTGAELRLRVQALDDDGVDDSQHTVTQLSLADAAIYKSKLAEIVIAAQRIDDDIVHCFNGKIEAPKITVDGIDNRLASTVYAWDLSANMSGCDIPEVHDASLALRLKNHPARAMTSSQWQGQEMCWRHAPELYAAIHFHEDDLIDVDWDTTFTWQVPRHIPSGVYMMHISDGEHEDAMPLFIVPPKGARNHSVAVLIPTFTYAIYGNHARPDWEPSWQEHIKSWNAYPYNPAQYPGYGLSTYNYHTDGSGICHASHRRPLFNLRPGYVTFAKTACSGLRHLQADSHLLAWLDAKSIGFDIVTDQQLHEEGASCIQGYDMLLTSTHPEYHTTQTLDALTHYRNNGGHISYLGGNGFYWRIALHPEDNAVLEIRRAEDGIRAWAAEPGEYYQAFDGQYGGLWRRNGRAPQALCGLGFTAQGQFNGSYYRKHPVDDDLAWIFAGIQGDVIGDFGLSGGGAAGFELDRSDSRLGTPENAKVIASSENHGPDFILVPEEMLTHITTLPGVQAGELLRADIVWFDVPGGGSVFAVGSITFCGSLPCNDFDNSVSRLLHNVVKHVCTN